jgi:hypothetical protein
MAVVQPSELGVTRGPLGRGSQNFVGSGYSKKESSINNFCVLNIEQHGCRVESVFSFLFDGGS